MKMITKRGIFLWILIIFFMVGVVILTTSLITNGDTWVMKTYNSHIYSDGELVGAGTITDCNGEVLAQTVDGERVYNDSSTVRKATLHTVGDTMGFISTSVQSQFRSKLVGYNILTGIYSITRYGSGNDMELTIDASVCEVAYEALSNYKAGCVGVVNYKTGDIVCMVSTPSYDVENVPSDIDTNSDYDGVYINRLLTGMYTPGSTFKLVTAICAIENISDIYERTWTCTGEYDPGEGTPIECAGTHGTIDFETALAKSCNAVFAQIAIELGPEKIAQTAKELGLTSTVYISEQIESTTGLIYLKESDSDDYVGWTGIGQGDTLLSPVAMLRLVSAIANGGSVPSFNIVNSLASKAGKALDLDITSKTTQLMSSDIASKMKSLMRNNVEVQYGDSNFPGLNLCAKSGTAQIDDVESHNTAWFVGFMDDDENPYAFVVIVEYGVAGVSTAAPIANKVLQALVNN